MPSKRRRGRGEGAVFYSESKRAWVARAVVGHKPDGKPRYKEVSAQTKGEALAKKRKAEEDARAGRLVSTKAMTTGQYLQHWLDNVSKPSVAVTTWPSYERCVRLHLKPRLGGIPLAELRGLHVEAMFADMQREGISGGNAKKVSEVLSTALEHAVRCELLPKSPAAKVAKPKAQPEEIVPFTEDEILSIRLAAHGNRLEALFALALSTGAREGELLALDWPALDLAGGILHVRRTLGQVGGDFLLKEPKSKRGRRQVELPPFAVDALHEHRKRMLAEGQDVRDGGVFVTKGGNWIGKSNLIRKVYMPLLKKAEVTYRKFHTFRHTHVSELLSRGVSVVDVARRVGDRPEVILKNYGHYIPGNERKIANRIQEMYG